MLLPMAADDIGYGLESLGGLSMVEPPL